MNDGSVLFCVWISRDLEDEGEGGRLISSFVLVLSFNSMEYLVVNLGEVNYGIL